MRKHFGILTLLAAMIIALFVPFTAIKVNAVEIANGSDGNEYQISANGASLNQWKSGASGKITIPDTVTIKGTTYKVFKVNNSAFYDPTGKVDFSKITSVTVGKNIQTIESHAFDSCVGLTTVSFTSGSVCTSIQNDAFAECTSLTSISLPSSLTSIGSSCFLGCSKLSSISIPSSVTEIGNSAFLQCSSLKNITLPSGLKTLGTKAFYQCTSLQSVDMSNCKNLTLINNETFASCTALTSVAFPPSLATIGNYVFKDCSLSEIRLPASIKTIGEGAFCSSGVSQVTILAKTAPTIVYSSSATKNSFKTTTKITVPTGAVGYTDNGWEHYKKITYSSDLTPATPTPTTKPATTATPTKKPTSTPTTKPAATPTSAPGATASPTTKPGVTVKPTVTTTPSSGSSTSGSSSSGSGSSGGSTGSSSSSSSSQGLGDFIERLYNIALGRPSESYGKNYWIKKVMNEGFTGADVARGFLFSDEFLNKNMSNSKFLDTLYMTFFNRPADAEKANWLKLMDQGWTKMQVIDGFINSTEWANLCLTYGIASGTNCKPNILIQPSAEVESFARRLYTTCLGRDADANGLRDWATQLANMQISGSDAAHGFFFSQEFIAQGFSNEEYVNRLYRTFMGREADPAGFSDWVGQLNRGASRESVFQGFAGSAEWAGICAEYGILK